MAKPKKPKKLAYELIRRETIIGRELYALLDDLVEKYHSDLRDAKIALAWNLAWKPDVDGRVILGKCRKASDLDRELVDLDFVIILRKVFVLDPTVNDDQRRALLDHELCHAALRHDADGEPTEDVRGRKMYRTRKHDLEEFSEIVARYGCYKRDLEAFAKALEKGRQLGAEAGWIGYRSLHEKLRQIALAIPLDVIHTWTDSDRRRVHAYVVLQLELAGVAPGGLWNHEKQSRESMPDVLAEALSTLEQTA